MDDDGEDEEGDEATPLVGPALKSSSTHAVDGLHRLSASATFLVSLCAVACAAAGGYAAGGRQSAGLACAAQGGVPLDCVGGSSVCSAAAVAAALNIGSEGTSGQLWRPVVMRRFQGGARALNRTDVRLRLRGAGAAPGRTCERWAVITTIFAPTRLVRQLVALGDWCVVVVGDLKAQSEASYLRSLNLSAAARLRLTYLDAAAQRRLNYRITAKLPWNHFGRKNVGFLFALQHGATVVYDTDDDNELLSTSAGDDGGSGSGDGGDDGDGGNVGSLSEWADLWTAAPQQRAAAGSGTRGAGAERSLLPELDSCAATVNPYPAFGVRWEGAGGRAHFAWPRGFPLESLRSCDAQPRRRRRAGAAVDARAHGAGGSQAAGGGSGGVSLRSVGVVQSLANHDPDVDAIYRLSSHLPLEFARPSPKRGILSRVLGTRESASPFLAGAALGLLAAEAEGAPFALPVGTMAPFNAQATLWARPALWGLLLPITVHGRVSDIWRGYIAQRLFWLIGQRLAFAPPWVRQLRNPHSYLADFQSEEPLYLRAGPLVRWLAAWQPSARAYGAGADGLPVAVQELSVSLYEIGVLELADVELQAAWLADLRELGYEFPRLLKPLAAGTLGAPARGVSESQRR